MITTTEPPSQQLADLLDHRAGNATISPVGPDAAHSIHFYYTSGPESPDGRWVLYYHSRSASGQTGELHIRDRRSGEVRALAGIQAIEDAHRVACQQWISGGRRVVFHDYRDGQWIVAMVDTETGRETLIARDRQVGGASPHSDIVPLYGLHWDPKGETDIQFFDAETGATRTVLSADRFKDHFRSQLSREPEFKNGNISLFFPLLSPDAKRMLFKIAAPRGGGPHHPDASVRKWLIGYDLVQSRFLFQRDDWGHPCWHPDSRHCIQVGNLLLDTNDGTETSIPGYPRFSGSHPSVSPDGQLFATDALLEVLEGGAKGSRGIIIGSMRGSQYRVIRRFDDSKGLRSWRPPHPHPSFSHDGRRLYFNVSATEWTRLHVAEWEATA